MAKPRKPEPVSEAQKDLRSYQDSPSLEDSHCEMLRDMKGFTGAKETDSEWLTKKNKVREAMNPFYAPYEPGVKR